jgi:hypothetical protein
MTRIPVFISSKMGELREDRLTLASVIDRTETLEPVFAENWAPRRATPEEAYVADALRCPIYVGLFWRIYSEATEQEYRVACSNTESEILLYIREAPESEREERLRLLLAEVHSGHVCSRYKDPSDLRNEFPGHLRAAVIRMVMRLHRLGSEKRSRKAGTGGRITADQLLRSWGIGGRAESVRAALEHAIERLTNTKTKLTV